MREITRNRENKKERKKFYWQKHFTRYGQYVEWLDVVTPGSCSHLLYAPHTPQSESRMGGKHENIFIAWPVQGGIMGNWSQKSTCFYSVWVRGGIQWSGRMLSAENLMARLQDTSRGSPELSLKFVQVTAFQTVIYLKAWAWLVAVLTSKGQPLSWIKTL